MMGVLKKQAVRNNKEHLGVCPRTQIIQPGLQVPQILVANDTCTSISKAQSSTENILLG